MHWWAHPISATVGLWVRVRWGGVWLADSATNLQVHRTLNSVLPMNQLDPGTVVVRRRRR